MNDFIDIDGNYREINNKLLQIAKTGKNMKPILKRAAHIIELYVDENFETEGKQSGQKWKSWSASYKAQREKRGRGNGRILSLEGELRESITSIVTDEEAFIGTNKEYAAIHNFGGDIKKRGGSGSFHMEARPYAIWTDELKKLVEDEVEGEISDIINKKS